MALEAGGLLTEQLKLLEPIGKGAMGSVWLAEDLSLQRRVAVKLIHAATLLKPTALERFRREATLAAKIKSPHVVSVYAHGVTSDGTPYIVMEHLEGRTLADEIDRHAPMKVEDVVAIATQIGRALGAAHQLGVVHRDIKPANIFVTEASGYDRFVKVVDFGIAKQPGTLSDDLHGRSDLTATGALIGTPRYMSPEQLIEAKDVDHRTDLWAMGVVIYQMLTRALPFAGDTVGALTLAVSTGEYTKLGERRSDLDADVVVSLERWLTRALCPRKDERFSSASEMVESLRAAARGEVVDPLSETEALKETVDAPMAAVPAATVDEPAGGVRRLWMGGAVVLAAAIGAFWWVSRERSVPPATASPGASASASAPPPATSARPERKPLGPRGKLAPEAIQSTMRAHFRALEQCRVMHSISRGVVRNLQFTIGEDGKVTRARLQELDMSTPELDACILEKLRAIVFPRPAGGVVDVVYPVVLSGEDAPLDDNACRVTSACITYGRCSARDGEECFVGSSAIARCPTRAPRAAPAVPTRTAVYPASANAARTRLHANTTASAPSRATIVRPTRTRAAALRPHVALRPLLREGRPLRRRRCVVRGIAVLQEGRVLRHLGSRHVRHHARRLRELGAMPVRRPLRFGLLSLRGRRRRRRRGLGPLQGAR